MSSIILLKEIFEDEDILGLIREGAYATEYDSCVDSIFPLLSKDLSIEQIQNVIWQSFYEQFCVGIIPDSKEEFRLEKEQAVFIIGSPERYRNLAYGIRHKILGL